MPRRNPPAKWVLPEIVDPPERVCYTVAVPKERQHIAAFWGALLNLASAIHWADDDAHTAKDVALVWREIVDNVCADDSLEGDCCMPCSPVNVNFNESLAPGETRSYRVVVEAAEFNILPIVLHANQSLTVSDFRGQWRDAFYHPEFICTSNWETPLGIVINAEGGAVADLAGADIMPTLPHYKLIMRVNACGVLSYHDLDDPMTFTVPESVPSEGVFVEFLANQPLDMDNEIAALARGYGMVCFKAIVSDPGLCTPVHINFSNTVGFTVIEGTIVDPSPIADGPALRSDPVGPSTATAIIEIALDDCLINDFGFSWYVHEEGDVQSFSVAWTIRDSEGNSLQSGSENIPWVQDTEGTMAIVVDQPDAATLRLSWNATVFPQFDNSMFWIDNVLVN